jgi:hypothetical protein
MAAQDFKLGHYRIHRLPMKKHGNTYYRVDGCSPLIMAVCQKCCAEVVLRHRCLIRRADGGFNRRVVTQRVEMKRRLKGSTIVAVSFPSELPPCRHSPLCVVEDGCGS